MSEPINLRPPHVHGRNQSVCFQPGRIWSYGVYAGDDPLTYSLPLVLLQLTLMIWLSRILGALLKPLRQPLVVCEIIAGILLGPTVFRPCGRKWEACQTLWESLFPRRGDIVMGIFSYLGIYYFIFVEGLKLDFCMIPRAGKKALLIGASGITVYALTVLMMSGIFKDYISKDLLQKQGVKLLSLTLAPSIFPTLQPILAELKLLNTDTGRLSMKVAMVDLVFYIVVTLGQQVLKHTYRGPWFGVLHLLTVAAIWAFFILVFRRIAVWMVRSTPEGQPARPAFILVMLLSVMAVSYISSVIAATAFELVFMMAVLVPSGPPLGSALIEKLETFCRAVLLPLFFVLNGLIIDLNEIDDWVTFGVWQLILLSGWVVKLIVTYCVGLYLQMPSEDAAALAFAGTMKGLIEPMVFYTWYLFEVIDAKMVATLNCTLVIMTCISAPMMQLLIERKGRTRRSHLVRSIEQCKPNTELRMLACVYTQDHAPSLLDLLDVSHPNKQSPICLYLLHLVELVGCAAPTLAPLKFQQRSFSHRAKVDKIIAVFRNFEKQSDGCVMVQPFLSVSPFETMHQDVCSLATEKKVSIVIVPFYKQLAIDGANLHFRNVAQNTMAEALCSVGILVDRGRPTNCVVGWNTSDINTYHVGILFLGGQDDREALSYVLRMAHHPRAEVTVLRCLGAYDAATGNCERERLLDDRAVGEFRLRTLDHKRVTYREEVVKNGVDIVVAIRSMRSQFDLMVVGRRHEVHSKIMNELLDWSEYEELGVIGDMLAAPDFAKFTFSILVVQQSTAACAVVKEEKTLHESTSETALKHSIADEDSRTQGIVEPRS